MIRKIGLQGIVILALLLAIPLGAWQMVFRPQNQSERELSGRIEAKQQRLNDLKHATAAIGRYRMQIDDLNKTIEALQARLPGEKEIDKVLHEVWQQAESCNMATSSIRTMQRVGEVSGPYSEQPIVVQLEGDFAGLCSFLQAIEQQSRLVRIATMSLEKNELGDEGTVRATIVMTVFFEGGRG